MASPGKANGQKIKITYNTPPPPLPPLYIKYTRDDCPTIIVISQYLELEEIDVVFKPFFPFRETGKIKETKAAD